MNERVDILLATYNGARFLREQLDSIVAQTHRQWRLLIRDDGSTDGTTAIIEEFRRRDPARIIRLEGSGGERGVIGNFSALLESATAAYTMFCDQDDLWLPTKIEATLALMKRLEGESGRDTPLLVYTDLAVIDDAGRELAASFWKYQQLNPRHGARLNRLLLHNIATGCSMMFNRPLRNMAVPIPAAAVMHDWWLALVAAAFGRGDFLPEPTVRYRQHDTNVVGAEPWSLIRETRRFLDPEARAAIARKRDRLLASYRLQAGAFLHRYGELLPAEERAMVATFATLDGCGRLMQKYYILKYRFFYSNPLVTAGMILFRW